MENTGVGGSRAQRDWLTKGKQGQEKQRQQRWASYQFNANLKGCASDPHDYVKINIS